jgi:N6-L-threonylcarbamoyladenine synthase
VSTARILAIETTCDETAAAVFTDEPRVLSNVVASQHRWHERFGGVVPEIAARAHLRQLLPMISEALREADTRLDQLAAVAVAHTPGLIGAILIGVSAAKTLAMTLDIPIIGVHHLEGHIYACQLAHGRPVFPCVGLVVSGGHSNFFVCRSPLDFELVGSTTDDAAGEAFDKVASLLSLGYPGGPAIERAARAGNPRAYDFPRTFLNDDRLDFSFSGIKTAVRYTVHGQNARWSERVLTPQETADLAASFQQAVVDVLVAKSRQAVRRFAMPRLCVGGGVAANSVFRHALRRMADEEGIELVVPPLEWCTDNAAMAAVAAEKFKSSQFDSFDLDAHAGLVRFG